MRFPAKTSYLEQKCSSASSGFVSVVFFVSHLNPKEINGITVTFAMKPLAAC